MSSHHLLSSILLLVGPDKATEDTRYQRGVKITSLGTLSPLYQKYADQKAATDAVIAENVTLGDRIDEFAKADAAFKKARTALGSAVVSWDGVYDVFVSTTEKYAVTPDDAASVGAVARPKTKHPLLQPVAVTLTQDFKRDRLAIHVHQAPGLTRTVVEVNNTDPANAAAWRELETSGSLHYIPTPAKGMWWVRAASRNTQGKSAFTAPVSLTVK